MFRNTQRHNVTSCYFYIINCSIVNSVTADGRVHIAESVGSRRELVVHTARARLGDKILCQMMIAKRNTDLNI